MDLHSSGPPLRIGYTRVQEFPAVFDKTMAARATRALGGAPTRVLGGSARDAPGPAGATRAELENGSRVRWVRICRRKARRETLDRIHR